MGRYPNQYSILDSFGTPCFLRADLRTSFLTYIMRTANTRVRRYEIGNVMRTSREGNKCGVQTFASIDTIWQQKWVQWRDLKQRPSQCELSVMYSWEAVLVSLQLMKPVSVMLHRPLLLHVNHVGVRVQGVSEAKIISTILEQYGVMDMGAKKQVVEKLRGLLKMQLVSISSTSG